MRIVIYYDSDEDEEWAYIWDGKGEPPMLINPQPHKDREDQSERKS